MAGQPVDSIEPISYSRFSTLLGLFASPRKEDPGCGWYMSGDRRSAASLHLDAKTEKWKFITFSWRKDQWKQETSKQYEELEAAEEALLAKLRGLSSHRVSTITAPFRLRFGRKPR